jgi:hypothetical protein
MMSMLCIRSSEKKSLECLPNGIASNNFVRERNFSRVQSPSIQLLTTTRASEHAAGPTMARRSARAPVILAGFQDPVFSLTT